MRPRVAITAAAVLAAFMTPGATADTGALPLNAVFTMVGKDATCPPGTPPTVWCYARTGTAVVPGLGNVAESYTYFVDTEPGGGCAGQKLLASAARWTVNGKGEIDATLAASPKCYTDVLQATRPFTVTGGSGLYANASGAGIVYHDAHPRAAVPSNSAGADTWQGTLSVAGLEFDLTPPVLSGASNRVVRARRGAKGARVRFTITARDEVDGGVPVSCRPKSGSRFRIGRTTVRCSATDTSGNTQRAKFTVIVKRRR